MNRANLGPGFTSSPVESQCASACDQLWVIYQFCNTPSVSLCFECHLVMRLGLRGLIKRGVMHFILALTFLNLFTIGRCTTTVYEYEPYNIPSDSFVANGPPMWVKHGSRLETSSRNLPSDLFSRHGNMFQCVFNMQFKKSNPSDAAVFTYKDRGTCQPGTVIATTQSAPYTNVTKVFSDKVFAKFLIGDCLE